LENLRTEIFVPEYIQSIKGICGEIVKDQSPSCLKKLREALFKLLVNCVPCDIIMYEMLKEFVERYKGNANLVKNITNGVAYYDIRINNGQKSLLHLEALIAKIMLSIAESK
jgi:hypothetical protein